MYNIFGKVFFTFCFLFLGKAYENMLCFFCCLSYNLDMNNISPVTKTNTSPKMAQAPKIPGIAANKVAKVSSKRPKVSVGGLKPPSPSTPKTPEAPKPPKPPKPIVKSPKNPKGVYHSPLEKYKKKSSGSNSGISPLNVTKSIGKAAGEGIVQGLGSRIRPISQVKSVVSGVSRLADTLGKEKSPSSVDKKLAKYGFGPSKNENNVNKENIASKLMKYGFGD